MLIHLNSSSCSIIRNRIRDILLPAIFVLSTVFLFIPFAIYQGNIDEFLVPVLGVLKYFFCASLILMVIICVIGLILPRKCQQWYVSTVFVIGMLIWLQGNILVWKYGLLGAGNIDLVGDPWRGWMDGILWAAILSLPLFLSRVLYKIAAVVSIIMISLQSILLISIIFQHQEILKNNYKLSASSSPPKEIYEFSSQQNVIHIILDEMQSDIFSDVIREELEYYGAALEGFTFFIETTASFPRTYLAIPAILSGENYAYEMPVPEFLEAVFNGRTISNILYDKGYEVDLAHALRQYVKGRYTNSFLIPIPYGVTKCQDEQVNSAFLLDLALFRIAPHFLKSYIYNEQKWFVQRLLNQTVASSRTRHFAHKAFLQDLIDNMSVARDKPVYKFIHLETTHGPAVVNDDCNYAGRALPTTRENFKIQYRCSLNHLVEFLDKLKSMGIYDSSLIILNADHGLGTEVKIKNPDKKLEGNLKLDTFSDRIVGAALPLMAIKPPYAKGSLRGSDAQTMLTDIPATISSLLGLNEDFKGRSAFKIQPGEQRERKFYYYEWRHKDWKEDEFKRLDEFIISGSVFDKASWRFNRTLYSAEKSYRCKKIDFGTSDEQRFLRYGWSGREGNHRTGMTYNWALGNQASLFLWLRKDKDVRLTANITSLKFDEPQCITIKVDGRTIGDWNLPNCWRWQEYSIVIPSDLDRPDVSVIEFSFSRHRIPKGEGDSRPLAVLFESLTLSEP